MHVVQLDSFVQAFYNIQVETLPVGALLRPPTGQLSSGIACIRMLKHIWHYPVLFPDRYSLRGAHVSGSDCRARRART
jgi:hypothetical protein